MPRTSVATTDSRMTVMDSAPARERLTGTSVISGMAIMPGMQEAHSRHAKEPKEADQKE